MSRFSYDREFKPSLPVYCRRPFIANGRHYKPGDVMDWRKLSIAQRKIVLMFGAGMLEHRKDAPEPVIAEPEPTITDELDLIDDLKELRAIADAEGAPYKVSKADQRQAIRDNRGN